MNKLRLRCFGITPEMLENVGSLTVRLTYSHPDGGVEFETLPFSESWIKASIPSFQSSALPPTFRISVDSIKGGTVVTTELDARQPGCFIASFFERCHVVYCIQSEAPHQKQPPCFDWQNPKSLWYHLNRSFLQSGVLEEELVPGLQPDFILSFPFQTAEAMQKLGEVLERLVNNIEEEWSQRECLAWLLTYGYRGQLTDLVNDIAALKRGVDSQLRRALVNGIAWIQEPYVSEDALPDPNLTYRDNFGGVFEWRHSGGVSGYLVRQGKEFEKLGIRRKYLHLSKDERLNDWTGKLVRIPNSPLRLMVYSVLSWGPSFVLVEVDPEPNTYVPTASFFLRLETFRFSVVSPASPEPFNNRSNDGCTKSLPASPLHFLAALGWSKWSVTPEYFFSLSHGLVPAALALENLLLIKSLGPLRAAAGALQKQPATLSQIFSSPIQTNLEESFFQQFLIDCLGIKDWFSWPSVPNKDHSPYPAIHEPAGLVVIASSSSPGLLEAPTVARLASAFWSRGFEVTVWWGLREVETAALPAGPYSKVLLVVNAHGDSKGRVYFGDASQPVPITTLYDALAAKYPFVPKICLLSTCRLADPTTGLASPTTELALYRESPLFAFRSGDRHPLSESLFAHAAAPNQASYGLADGSVFLNLLADCLQDLRPDEDVESLVTRVARKLPLAGLPQMVHRESFLTRSIIIGLPVRCLKLPKHK